jgi:flavin-dependent dehydrogenase
MVFEVAGDPAMSFVAHPDRCIGCMACEEDCPAGSLRVYRLPAGFDESDLPRPADGLDAGRTWDLVVVGAGPAGLGAAIRGRLLGMDVVVLDRLPSPRRSHHPDGGLLFAPPDVYRVEDGPAGFRIPSLDFLIPASDIRERLHHFVFMGPGGVATKRSKETGPGFPAVDKDLLLRRLVERALDLGAVIAWNTRVQRIRNDGPGDASVELEGGIALRGRVVIGAEGSTGRLAARAGAPVNEEPVCWSYGMMARFPARPAPVDEAGFMVGRPAGFSPREGFLGYWASGKATTEVMAGTLQRQRWRVMDRPIQTLLDDIRIRDERIAHRLGGPWPDWRDAPEVDGCRVFARRLPRSALANRLIAVGDSLATCGMMTNLVALRTGEIAAETARQAIAGGNMTAAGMAGYDERVFSLSMVRGLHWMHSLLIEAPLRLSDDNLAALFGILRDLDLGKVQTGTAGGTWEMIRFFLRNSFSIYRRPDLRKYLIP